MGTVNVTIENPDGRKFKAQVPNEVPLERLLPELVEKLGLLPSTHANRSLQYKLVHMESGKHLLENKPGASTG